MHHLKCRYEKRPFGSHNQTVTFANGLYPYFHSIVKANPIPIETKCH